MKLFGFISAVAFVNDALRECINDCDASVPTEPSADQCLTHCDHQHEQQLAHCRPGDQKCIDKPDQNYHHCINRVRVAEEENDIEASCRASIL